MVLCPTNNEQCPYRVRCCFAVGQRGQANYGRVARGLTDLLPGSGGSSVLIGWVCSHLSSGRSIDLIHLSEAAIAKPAATATDQPSVAEGAEAQDFEREVAKLTALSLADLSARLGAAATADTAPAVSVTRTQCFKRDPLVAAYARVRGGFRCEVPGCAHPVFEGRDGRPYSEVHHIEPLAEGGADMPANVASLLPGAPPRGAPWAEGRGDPGRAGRMAAAERMTKDIIVFSSATRHAGG